MIFCEHCGSLSHDESNCTVKEATQRILEPRPVPPEDILHVNGPWVGRSDGNGGYEGGHLLVDEDGVVRWRSGPPV